MIQTQTGAKLQVPDGLSQQQIGEVVDHYMAQQPGQTPASAPPASASAAPSAPSPPPAAVSGSAGQPSPSAATAAGSNFGGYLDDADKMAQDFSNTALFGVPGELGAKEATGLQYLAGVLTPGKGHDLKDINARNEKIKMQRQSGLQAWNDENPGKNWTSQIAGGLATMGPLSKLVGAAGGVIADALPEAPEVISSALQKLEAAYPKAAKFAKTAGSVSAAGAGVGGLYTGAQAAPGDTSEATAEGAGVGAGVGTLAKFGLEPLANEALGIVAPKVKAAVSGLQDFLKSSEDQAASPASPTLGFSNITNQPLGATPAASGPVTGKLPLSPGVASKDANLLRIEENAKQGLLGPDAQNQMTASNNAVYQAARDAMQSLKGVTNKDSDGILTDAVSQFQKQAAAVKSTAQGLYQQRDAAMADAVLNKNKVGPSLGAALDDVVTAPSNTAGFKSKSGAAAQGLVDDFKNLITGTQGKELPFSDLAAWRQDVAHLATTDQSTAGNMAGKLGRAYDDWMDNITQNHFISGDPNAASLAKQASSAWKNYKTLFGSENSPVISGMTKPYDATPADFVDKVFGANIAGNGNTALNVRKMAAVLPPEAQAGFKDNIFSGLISRAFEGAGDADQVSLGKLRNNLSTLQNSAVYKEHFAADPTKDPVITNLIKDLSQQITQTGRKDITSPSGGAVMRGVQQLTGQLNSGLGKYVPFVSEADGLVNKVADMGQNSADKSTFNAAMKSAAKTAHANARNGPVFDINSLKAGIAGGTVAGAAMQPDQPQGAQ